MCQSKFFYTYYCNLVPELGGATVFPNVGARIQPVRRSAAFWFNLLSSGERDYKTFHAACPILLGNKWVSNKWIHEKGELFNRPCLFNDIINSEI